MHVGFGCLNSFSVHGKTTCRQIQYRRTKFPASKANAYIHTNIVYIICIFMYLQICPYGDATSHNITEMKSHANLFFLLRSDMGIHEAGLQDPANVPVWTSLGHGDKTKRISCKKSSTHGQNGLQILQQEIEDCSIKLT